MLVILGPNNMQILYLLEIYLLKYPYCLKISFTLKIFAMNDNIYFVYTVLMLAKYKHCNTEVIFHANIAQGYSRYKQHWPNILLLFYRLICNKIKVDYKGNTTYKL